MSRKQKLLYYLYKSAVPIKYDESFFSGESPLSKQLEDEDRQKERLKRYTKNIKEDVIFFNQEIFKSPNLISGAIAFKHFLNTTINSGNLKYNEDAASTVTTSLTKEEFLGLISDMHSLYEFWFKHDIDSDYLEAWSRRDEWESILSELPSSRQLQQSGGESWQREANIKEARRYINPELKDMDGEHILSSIMNFKDRILKSWKSESILFIPLLYENRDTSDLINFYRSIYTPGKHYLSNLKHFSEIDQFDFLPENLIHDFMGHGFSNYFNNFVLALNNLLKELERYLPNPNGLLSPSRRGRVPHQKLLDETSRYIFKVSNTLDNDGFDNFYEIFGFSPDAIDAFDKIYDAFIVLSQEGELSREAPIIYLDENSSIGIYK